LCSLPRVAPVVGSKNIRTSEAAPVKSRRSPARATNAGRAITPVPAASCRPSPSSVLTSYSRYSGGATNIVPSITKTKPRSWRRRILMPYSPNCVEKLSEKSWRHLRRIPKNCRRGTFRPFHPLIPVQFVVQVLLEPLFGQFQKGSSRKSTYSKVNIRRSRGHDQ
jgi:hypothetical protein